MNIWHYIHPHYRYDIQEMKIVLAKQLPFSFYLVIIELFHIPSSRKCCISLCLGESDALSTAWLRKKSPFEIFHIVGSRDKSG